MAAAGCSRRAHDQAHDRRREENARRGARVEAPQAARPMMLRALSVSAKKEAAMSAAFKSCGRKRPRAISRHYLQSRQSAVMKLTRQTARALGPASGPPGSTWSGWPSRRRSTPKPSGPGDRRKSATTPTRGRCPGDNAVALICASRSAREPFTVGVTRLARKRVHAGAGAKGRYLARWR